MRLEGRSHGCGHSSEKQVNPERITTVSRGSEMCDTLHLPARLAPRHRDVASASELPATEAQERHPWPWSLPPSNSPTFVTTPDCSCSGQATISSSSKHS